MPSAQHACGHAMEPPPTRSARARITQAVGVQNGQRPGRPTLVRDAQYQLEAGGALVAVGERDDHFGDERRSLVWAETAPTHELEERRPALNVASPYLGHSDPVVDRRVQQADAQPSLVVASTCP